MTDGRPPEVDAPVKPPINPQEFSNLVVAAILTAVAAISTVSPSVVVMVLAEHAGTDKTLQQISYRGEGHTRTLSEAIRAAVSEVLAGSKVGSIEEPEIDPNDLN